MQRGGRRPRATHARRNMRMSPVDHGENEETDPEQLRGAIPTVPENNRMQGGPSSQRSNRSDQEVVQEETTQNTVQTEAESPAGTVYDVPSYVDQELDIACLQADLKRQEAEALRKSERILTLERETQELRERLARTVNTQRYEGRQYPTDPGWQGQKVRQDGQRDAYAQRTPQGPMR